jgi:hypothetical protein
MSLKSNIQEEEQFNLGFKTALYIDVPNWDKDKCNNKSNNEAISVGNTPEDKNKLTEFNKSLISNLIPKDLLKKLEEESPSKTQEIPFDNYLENLYGIKLSFEEEDLEDSETKVSRQSKMSKDSYSSYEKINERKSNSFHYHLINNREFKNYDFNMKYKYPSSMDNNNQGFLKSKEKENSDFIFNTYYINDNNNNNNKSNSKIKIKIKIKKNKISKLLN